MPDRKENARGGKRMNKAAAASRHVEEPSFGEAALREALARFGVAPEAAGGFGATESASSANGSHTAGATAQAHAEPAPKTVAQVLGEITWLMTQSPRHKAIRLGDLEWMLMPAIILKQFRIFYRGERPVGVAVWALVDELVAKRIDAGDRRLTAVEWKSGANMRIVDVVAPFGGEAEMRGQVDGQ
jgi:cytolysin-activating lysine-acyltransferase